MWERMAQFVGNHIMRNAFSGSGISHVDVIGNSIMLHSTIIE